MAGILGQRLETVRSHMKWTQDELALAVGISQEAISKKISSGMKLKYEQAQRLHKQTGFSLNWLMTGEGEPGVTLSIVSEDTVLYGKGNTKMTKPARQERFSHAIDVFKKDMDYNEASRALRLDTSHASGVRNGHKDVSVEMLAKSVKYGNINANYVLVGIEPVILSKAADSSLVASLERRIEELEERNRSLETDKRNLQMLVDLLPNDVRKTA